MNRREFQLGLAALLAGGAAPFARGEGQPKRRRGLPNVKSSTSGGQQFWGDVRYHAGYRIQQHALTGHHRLLDPDYQRIAWGMLSSCEAALRDIRQEQPELKNSPTAVVFLHGLFRTRWSMSRIAERVGKETGWQPIVLGYPSTRGSVGDHAKMLAKTINHLDDVQQIHFVAHSLGNLVIRYWLGNKAHQNVWGRSGRKIGRMVMLGPPNHRPSLAQTLVPIDANHIIAGEAGLELQNDWEKLEPKLATPSFDFGILAGGTADGAGHNPLIPGDDDMIVGVDETRLTGARDFRVLQVIHATMMDEDVTQEMTARFLQHGYFESPEARAPLEPKEEQVSQAAPPQTE
ncbi:esterase/lipase family protein [Aeoliella sp.]|uniref:esterase/lipase family protein n=1 Tax=Aeoliella sp. TaxID=2795800 RepID=UPI003CCBA190